jgi:UDP-N-acetylglucosamine 2-epimerase (non-hydrolysing)
VPCLTVRENTERPVTITIGTNVLVGRDTNLLSRELDRVMLQGRKNNGVPPLWDGHAAERIAEVIVGKQATLTQENLSENIPCTLRS